ncbi:hypothetical protein GCM10022420_087470 [Streptomyces iranensis]
MPAHDRRTASGHTGREGELDEDFAPRLLPGACRGQGPPGLLTHYVGTCDHVPLVDQHARPGDRVVPAWQPCQPWGPLRQSPYPGDGLTGCRVMVEVHSAGDRTSLHDYSADVSRHRVGRDSPAVVPPCTHPQIMARCHSP